MNSGVQIAQDVFQQIVGMTPTRVVLGHGSFITLDFGKDIVEEYKTRKGMRSFCHGEWYLWVYMCAWRIDKGGKPLVGSNDSRDKIEETLALFTNKALTKVTILSESFDVCLNFEEDIELHLFSFSFQDEQWMFFTPGGKVFTAGPGNEWKFSIESTSIQKLT